MPVVVECLHLEVQEFNASFKFDFLFLIQFIKKLPGLSVH